MGSRPQPNGRERTFAEDALIVSKTDLAGVITYANRLFVEVSGYAEEDLLGAPHSLIRHPDMPRAVFALLWSELAAGREVFAFVKNLAADGAHYWVLAHVTPSIGPDGAAVGYHSSRRAPDRGALARVEPLYAAMRAAEETAGPGPVGIAAGTHVLERHLHAAGSTYEELAFALAG